MKEDSDRYKQIQIEQSGTNVCLWIHLDIASSYKQKETLMSGHTSEMGEQTNAKPQLKHRKLRN